MLARAAGCAVTCLLVLGCAHAPETVMHFSAGQDARWEVRDVDGAHLCWLPCNVELDEQEFVTVVRSDGRTRFVVRQEDVGRGDFSASVRAQRKHTTGTLMARVLGAALSGAGSALAESDDREHVAAGVILSSLGEAARAASDIARPEQEELWVQRTQTP